MQKGEERVRLAVCPERALYAANVRGRLVARTFTGSPADRGVVEAVKAWSRAATPDPAGLCLCGPTQAGKTGLAVAAAQARWRRENAPGRIYPVPGLTEWHLCASTLGSDEDWRARCDASLWRSAAFAPVLFTTWVALEHQLRLALTERRFDEMLEALEDRVGLLVLDDLDTGSYSPWRESVLFSLLERPLRGRRIIVTLNRNPDAPTELLTDRLVSRLNNPELFLKLEV